MNLGCVEAIVLDNAVGIGSNVSLKAMVCSAVLFCVTCGSIPCVAAIVTFPAARCFYDGCVNTSTFFKDNVLGEFKSLRLATRPAWFQVF